MTESDAPKKPAGILGGERAARRKKQLEQALRDEANAPTGEGYLPLVLTPDRELVRTALREIALPALAHTEAKHTTEQRPVPSAAPAAEISLLTPTQVREAALQFSWKELERRFRELHEQADRNPDTFDAWYRHFHWDDGTETRQWMYSRSGAIVDRFQSLAVAAARKLGVRDREDADYHWLALVREKQGFRIHLNTITLSEPPRSAVGDTATVKAIAEASADLCLKLIAAGTPECRIELPPVVTLASESTIAASKAKKAPRKRNYAASNRKRVESARDRVKKKLADPSANPAMSVEEASLAFSKSRATIYRWISEGKLKSTGVAGRIQTSSVERLLRAAADEE